MRKIIIGVAVLALLGGGGAGAYLYLKKPAEAALPEEGHAAAAPEKEKGGHGEKKAAGGHGASSSSSGPTYVKMDPLIVPIVDGDGVSQVVSMIVAFEVEDAEQAVKIEHLKPRIKDAFIQNLYGLLNQQSAMDNCVLKVGYVKKRLNDAAQKVVGDGVVKDVLLQMVQQNPV